LQQPDATIQTLQVGSPPGPASKAPSRWAGPGPPGRRPAGSRWRRRPGTPRQGGDRPAAPRARAPDRPGDVPGRPSPGVTVRRLRLRVQKRRPGLRRPESSHGRRPRSGMIQVIHTRPGRRGRPGRGPAPRPSPSLGRRDRDRDPGHGVLQTHTNIASLSAQRRQVTHHGT
jgi:hypothetical protein